MPDLRLETADGVATLTLDRPEALNALTVQVKVALRESLERIAADRAQPGAAQPDRDHGCGDDDGRDGAVVHVQWPRAVALAPDAMVTGVEAVVAGEHDHGAVPQARFV